MKQNKFLGLILLANVACQEVSKDTSRSDLKDTSLSGFKIEQKVDTFNYHLIINAVNKGDTSAYESLSLDYWREEKSEDLFLVSFIVANKYDNACAYYDLYSNIVHSYLGLDIETLDKKTKCFALYFLLKAKEKGDERALSEAQEYFGSKKIPSSNSYLLELTKNP
jgi:hypothetical protein